MRRPVRIATFGWLWAAGAVVALAACGPRGGATPGGTDERASPGAADGGTAGVRPAGVPGTKEAAGAEPSESGGAAETAAGAGRTGTGSAAPAGGDDGLRPGQPIPTAAAPYVRVSFHPGDITGAVRRAGADVRLTLAGPDGTVRGTGRARTDDDGRFGGWVHAPDGRRVRPAAGDTLTVDDGAAPRDVVVQGLTGDWDLAANRLFGSGPPGARIEIVLWNPWHPGETDTPATAVGADGTWSVTPAVPLRPASHFYITAHLAGDDLLYLCRQIPMLYIQPGSAAVEVQTLWEIRAALTLERGGQRIAAGTAGGPWSGNVTVVLRDPAGAPAAVQAGDTLVAELDDKTISVDVPPLEVEAKGDGGAFAGRAAPGQTLGLAWPENPIADVGATAAADGTFEIVPNEAARDPDRDVEVYAMLASGHTVRRRFTRPALDVTLGSRTVVGTGEAGSRVSLRLLAAGGAPVAETVADVGAAGGFTATFGADAPAPRPGDVVGVRALPDGPETRLALPDIAAALDLAGGIVRGTGPTDAVLDVVVHVGDGDPPNRLAAFVDDDGTWSVDLRNPVSGLSVMDLGQIGRVEVERHEGRHVARLAVR